MRGGKVSILHAALAVLILGALVGAAIMYLESQLAISAAIDRKAKLRKLEMANQEERRRNAIKRAAWDNLRRTALRSKSNGGG